jgi:hypothetical protein
LSAAIPGARLTGAISDIHTSAPPPPATLSDAEWAERLAALHRQLFASEAPEFDEVMRRAYKPPEGYVLADHCVVHDGANWHLYYITGPIKYADEWIGLMRARKFAEARKIPYEMSDGHAAGTSLLKLRYRNDILTEPQGDFGLLLQGTSSIIRFEDHWLNVYTGRGPDGQCLCVARSRDLDQWEYEPANPVWRPPSYAVPPPWSACKNPHVIRHPTDGRWLVYYCLSLRDGTMSVALLSTTDFRSFTDHGPVFKMPTQLRGTGGCEAPCIIHRNGVWHLFTGAGPGVWHAISHTPDDFMGFYGRDGALAAAARLGAQRGCYLFGRFHAVEVFEHNGRWWMTSTRKDHQRWLNRKAGVLKFRGSAADETTMLDGMFLCEIRWDGDQPIPTCIDDPTLV